MRKAKFTLAVGLLFVGLIAVQKIQGRLESFIEDKKISHQYNFLYLSYLSYFENILSRLSIDDAKGHKASRLALAFSKNSNHWSQLRAEYKKEKGSCSSEECFSFIVKILEQLSAKSKDQLPELKVIRESLYKDFLSQMQILSTKPQNHEDLLFYLEGPNTNLTADQIKLLKFYDSSMKSVWISAKGKMAKNFLSSETLGHSQSNSPTKLNSEIEWLHFLLQVEEKELARLVFTTHFEPLMSQETDVSLDSSFRKQLPQLSKAITSGPRDSISALIRPSGFDEMEQLRLKVL